MQFLEVPFTLNANAQTFEEEIKTFQKTLNQEFLDPDESPLSRKDRKKFKGHSFFPVDIKYRIKAKFIKSSNPMPFKMKTSTSEVRMYDRYGVAVFELDGKTFKLNIYQSHRLRRMEEYKDYLFVPFTDRTNGDETYGGGRYLDLKIPSGWKSDWKSGWKSQGPPAETIILDFNKAYNPFCAYSHNYSCPVPPRENDLKIRIEAGVKNLNL